MIDSNEIIDNLNFEKDSHVEDQWIVSVPKFLFLCFMSLGLYPIWWFYKEWRFFNLKDGLDILPAARAIFAIIFIFPLLKNINDYALSKNISKSVNSTMIGIFFIVTNLLGRLPSPYFCLSILSFLFLIPAVNLINETKSADEELNVYELKGFNTKQIILIIVGAIFWVLLIMSLFMEDGDATYQ